MTPFAGYAPDVDPTTPGIFTDCQSWIPTVGGYEAAATGTNATGISALAAECRNIAALVKLDATVRLIAGTQTKLYEVASGSNTDVSRAGSYTGSADSRWSFTQFGNVSIASNGTETMQFSNTSGAFADIATAPKARIVVTASGFVMALNYNDGTATQDGWFCSGLQDYTIWTPAISTQCAKGRLLGTNGEITAGSRLGDTVVAFKDSAIYLGQYVGPPVIWSWIEVSQDIGACGQDAVVNMGAQLFFAHRDGLYMFDGTRPVDISAGVIKNFWQADLNQQYRKRVICQYDRLKNRIFIFYPNQNSTTGNCNACLVYHVSEQKWGRTDQNIESAMQYISPSITYDSIGTILSTYDSGLGVTFDSSFWSSGTRANAIVNTSHQLQILAGTPATSYFTTGDQGDMNNVSSLKRVRVQYQQTPTSATCEVLKKMNLGDALTTTQTVSLSGGKFDVRQSARWHRATVTNVGTCKALGVELYAENAGDR